MQSVVSDRIGQAKAAASDCFFFSGYGKTQSEIHRIDRDGAVHGGENHGENIRVLIQVPHGRTEPYAVIEHDTFVDEYRAGHCEQHKQNTAVPSDAVSKSEEQKCGKDIPLMHFHAEYIQDQKQKSSEERKKSYVSEAYIIVQHNDKCEHHNACSDNSPGASGKCADQKEYRKAASQHRLNPGFLPDPACSDELHRSVAGCQQRENDGSTYRGGMFNGTPVSAPKIIEVRCIDSRIRIRRQGSGILIDNPERFLPNAERNENRQHDNERRRETSENSRP